MLSEVVDGGLGGREAGDAFMGHFGEELEKVFCYSFGYGEEGAVALGTEGPVKDCEEGGLEFIFYGRGI